jgi:hypothetical protein
LRYLSQQGISGRKLIGGPASKPVVPADFEIHGMRRVLYDLLCHGEKPRIVNEESLVQVGEKANRGKKQRRPCTAQNSDYRDRLGCVAIRRDF